MPTIACEVIIPTVSGRTRLPWTPNKIPDWENAAAYLFGGISPIALGVVGKWRNPAAPPGKGIVPDPQNRYEVAVPDDRVGELREFMRFTCAHFEQECLYFKVGSTVEFLDNPLGWP
jgi:hypothetical protein